MKKLFFSLFVFTCTTQLFAQPVVDYAKAKDYIIGGIVVEGADYTKHELVIAYSGLKVGEEISIPGDDISKAITHLWDQNLFTDVKILLDKDRTIGSTAFLIIRVVERPKLSKFKFTGLRKSEEEEVKDDLGLRVSWVLTDNMKLNAVYVLNEYFRKKGYLDINTTTTEIVDTTANNSVILILNVDKGSKVKIDRIYFDGNDNANNARLRQLMKDTKQKIRFHPKEVLDFSDLKEDSIGLFDVIGNFSPIAVYNYFGDKMNVNIFGSSKFDKDDFEKDERLIISYYNSIGYRDAKIERDTVVRGTDGDLDIYVYINEGVKYYFRNIVWSGNAKYGTDTLNRLLRIKKGDIYNEEKLQERLFMSATGTDVSSLYMDDGYLFFNITPVEKQIIGDSIDIELVVYEGPQAIVNRIIIEGNTKTKEHVIRRELRDLPGSKFSRQNIIRSTREIAALGYFNPETIDVQPIPHPEDGTVDLVYTVEEKPSDQLEMSAGYGGKGRGVVGSLGVQFTNFSLGSLFKKGAWDPLPAGDGQNLSLRIQSNGKVYQSYNFSFTEPWLGGKKANSLTLSYYQTRFASYDTQAEPDTLSGRLLTTGVTLGLGTRLKWPDDYFVLTSALNFQNYNLNNWTRTNFVITDGNSNQFTLKETITRSNVGLNPYFPHMGSRFSLSLQLTPPYTFIRESLLGENINYATQTLAEKYKWVEFHKWRFDAEWYTSLSRNNKLVLKASAKLGYVGLYNRNLGISPFERFQLGGDGISYFSFLGNEIFALRGYDELNPNTAAPIFNKFTLEMRYAFSLNPNSTIYGLAFLEGGNVYDSFKEYNPFELKRSAGVGLRVYIPVFGLLGFDYGIGFDKFTPNKTETFGDLLRNYGKFSIILGFEPE